MFRLTLPRIAGAELGSPLPLGPDDAELAGLGSTGPFPVAKVSGVIPRD